MKATAGLLCLAAATLLTAAEGLHVLGRIHIGGEGGWDYVTVDSAARRIYVSHATKVAVVDADSEKVVGEIPDMGLRVGTPLGPLRLDVAYNEYARQEGSLYQVTRTGSGVPSGLTLVNPTYGGPPRGTGFFQRLQFQFSVGEAF